MLISDEFGKVGSKGELYLPKKLRNVLGLEPNSRIRYFISPRGYLIIEKVIRVLDKEAPPDCELNWWRAQAEQLKPDNEEDLRRFVVLREIAWQGVMAAEAASVPLSA